MDITIREINPQRDYERVAEIINFYEPEAEAITAAQLHEGDKYDTSGQIYRRIVAVDSAGRVLGYGAVMQSAWMKPNNLRVLALVDPAYCNQGIGTRLHESNLEFARENGATALNTWVFDDQPQSVHFAESQGFTVERHIFESTLHLKTFDERRFAGVVEAVEASGIRLFSLAEVGITVETLHKLWDVNYRTYLDDPGSSGAFPDFEAFQKSISGDWFRLDGHLLAADGDTYIGLSSVGYNKDNHSANNRMTGVLPQYRGRKIALALKILSIRAAQKWGVDTISTNNDSQNAPMLAINRKLGYVPQPGGYRMIHQLSAAQ